MTALPRVDAAPRPRRSATPSRRSWSATLPRFPTAGDRFVVADRARARVRPRRRRAGIRSPHEVWASGDAALAGVLAAAPYDRLAVTHPGRAARRARVRRRRPGRGLAAARRGRGVAPRAACSSLVLLVVGRAARRRRAAAGARGRRRRDLDAAAQPVVAGRRVAVPALVAGTVAGLVLTRVGVDSLVALSARGIAPDAAAPARGRCRLDDDGARSSALALALARLRAGRGADAALGVAVAAVGGDRR